MGVRLGVGVGVEWELRGIHRHNLIQTMFHIGISIFIKKCLMYFFLQYHDSTCTILLRKIQKTVNVKNLYKAAKLKRLS